MHRPPAWTVLQLPKATRQDDEDRVGSTQAPAPAEEFEARKVIPAPDEDRIISFSHWRARTRFARPCGVYSSVPQQATSRGCAIAQVRGCERHHFAPSCHSMLHATQKSLWRLAIRSSHERIGARRRPSFESWGAAPCFFRGLAPESIADVINRKRPHHVPID